MDILMNERLEELIRQTIDRFWETFPSVWNIVRSHTRSLAAESFGITVEQFHILRHIRKGKVCVSDLATERRISRPAISQEVNALVNKGLIARQHDTDDRRYVQLTLTESGAALLEDIFGQNRQWMMSKLAVLSPDELQSAIQAMGLLKNAFDETV
jgi:DNA-binding MarR family transcriptional regulator